MATPDHLDPRRERAAAAEGLDGWYLARLCDAETETGEPISWYEYEHLDGRQATVSESGSSTDPELQRLLAEKRQSGGSLPAVSPRWASATGLIRWLARRGDEAQ